MPGLSAQLSSAGFLSRSGPSAELSMDGSREHSGAGVLAELLKVELPLHRLLIHMPMGDLRPCIHLG